MKPATVKVTLVRGRKSPRLKVTEAEYVAVINEWWRMFTEDPTRFEHQAATVVEVLKAEQNGTEPTFGQRDLAFFKFVLQGIREKKEAFGALLHAFTKPAKKARKSARAKKGAGK